MMSLNGWVQMAPRDAVGEASGCEIMLWAAKIES